MPHLRLLLPFLAAPTLLAAQALAPPPPHAAPAAPPTLPSPILDRIHAAHSISCGVSKEEEDYSRATDHGNRAAFDIDLCKAVSIATLGPGAHLVVKSFPDEPAALQALYAGDVDLLATSSLTVDGAAHGLSYSAPVFLDGQGFLLPNNPAVHSPLDLRGKKVCFLTGSAAEDGLHTYAAAHGIAYIWYPFSEAGEMEAAFFTGNCDAISGDLSNLANIRAIDPARSAGFTLLPETIRPDPLAVTTLSTDPKFANILFWTVQTLFSAEALGLTAGTVPAELQHPSSHTVSVLLGEPLGTGQRLGLRPTWGADVLSSTGNFGEIFRRDLGDNSRLRIPRADNRLVQNGGALNPIIPTN